MVFNSEVSLGLPEQLSNPLAQDFDYAALDTETQIVVKQCTSEIKALMRRSAQDIVDIGQKLIEVKEKLEHGYFRKWLKAEFKWSVSAATRFMQVGEQFKYTNLIHLSIAASALYELAAPSTPEPARLEALNRANSGETITRAKAKAIKTKASTRQRKEPINKPQPDEPITIDIDAETVGQELPTEGKIPEAPLSWQYPADNSVAVENSEEELLGEETNSEIFDSHKGESNPKASHLRLVNEQDQLSNVEPNYPSPLNMNKPLFTTLDSTDTVLVEPVEPLSEQQVANILATLPQADVVNLCNKCLDVMGYQAFSRLAVDKINFSGLTQSALNLLIQKSQREMDERQRLA